MMSSEDCESTFESKFNLDDRVCVKLRGIPFRVEDEMVYDFFAGYEYIEGSLVIGVRNDGKRTGEAVILFLTEEDAIKACEEKNGNTMGERWIETYVTNFKFYQQFPDICMGKKENTIGDLLLDKGNRNRAVRLRGIPFSADKDDILKFMDHFTPKEDDIHFEIRQGRFSGRAIVFLEDEDQAISASEELHKKYIGSRYIEVEPCCKIDNMY